MPFFVIKSGFKILRFLRKTPAVYISFDTVPYITY